MKPVGCRDMTAMEWAQAVQLYLDGATAAEVAAEYGRHRSTISNFIRDAGLRHGRRFYKGPRARLVAKMLANYPPELHP